MTYKLIIGAALLASLSWGAAIASASVVTGTLSSSGVVATQSGTTGTLTGSVTGTLAINNSGGGSGGGGSSGGGGGAVSGPLAFGYQNGSGTTGTTGTTGSTNTTFGGNTGGVAPAVLGVSTDISNTSLTNGSESSQDQSALAVNSGTNPTDVAGLPLTAAVANSGVGLAWWVWLLLVIVLAAAGYYTYRRYYAKRRFV